MIPFADIPDDELLIAELEVTFPRLDPDDEASAPLGRKEIWSYLEADWTDGEATRSRPLAFRRTAVVYGIKTWLWEYTDGEGEQVYVTCEVAHDGRPLLGCEDNPNGYTAEQWLLWNYTLSWWPPVEEPEPEAPPPDIPPEAIFSAFRRLFDDRPGFESAAEVFGELGFERAHRGRDFCFWLAPGRRSAPGGFVGHGAGPERCSSSVVISAIMPFDIFRAGIVAALPEELTLVEVTTPDGLTETKVVGAEPDLYLRIADQGDQVQVSLLTDFRIEAVDKSDEAGL